MYQIRTSKVVQMIALAKIMDASRRLKGVVEHTKLAFAPKLSELSQAKVYVKQ